MSDGSYYPKPDTFDSSSPYHPSNPQPPSTTQSSSPPDPSSEQYDLLLSLPCSITPPPISDTLRVLQFAASDSFHAFLSIASLNIPLLPTFPVFKKSSTPPTYQLQTTETSFTLTFDSITQHQNQVLENILQWYCRWEDKDPAHGLISPSNKSAARIARAGDKGVAMVESLGTKVHQSIQRKLTTRVEAAKEKGQPKDMKLGGKATSTILGSVRGVVGVGAKVAARVTDKVADIVGKGMSENRVSRGMAEADEGTKKRAFHDNLRAGLVAFGKVFIEADRQGKIIIEGIGEGGAELASAKYGKDAEEKARMVGGIALDGYRVARFPQKLGVTAVFKGALKSTAQKADGTQAIPVEVANGAEQFNATQQTASGANQTHRRNDTLNTNSTDTLI